MLQYLKMADEKSGPKHPTVLVVEKSRQFSQTLEQETPSLEQMKKLLDGMLENEQTYKTRSAELEQEIESANKVLVTYKSERQTLIDEQVRLSRERTDKFDEVKGLEEGVQKYFAEIGRTHIKMKSDVTKEGKKENRSTSATRTSYANRLTAIKDYKEAIETAGTLDILTEIDQRAGQIAENGVKIQRLDKDIAEANANRETYATELDSLVDTTGAEVAGQKEILAGILGNIGYQLTGKVEEPKQFVADTQAVDREAKTVMPVTYDPTAIEEGQTYENTASEETPEDGEDQILIVDEDGIHDPTEDEEEIPIADGLEEGDEVFEEEPDEDEEIPVEFEEPVSEIGSHDGLFAKVDAGKPSQEIDAPFAEETPRLSHADMLEGMVGDKKTEDSALFPALMENGNDSGTNDLSALNAVPLRESSIPAPDLSNIAIQTKYGISEKATSIQRSVAKVYKNMIAPVLNTENEKSTLFKAFRPSLKSEGKEAFRHADSAKRYGVTSLEDHYNPEDEVHTLRAQSFCYSILGLMHATNKGMSSTDAYVKIEELTTELFETYSLDLENKLSGDIPIEILEHVERKKSVQTNTTSELDSVFHNQEEGSKKHRSLVMGYKTMHAMIDLLCELTNPAYVAEVLKGEKQNYVPSGSFDPEDSESLQITCYKTLSRLSREKIKEEAGELKTKADKRALTLAVNRYRTSQTQE